MFLDNYEGLLELTQERMGIKEVIENYRKEVLEKEEEIKKLNKEIQDIQVKYTKVHQDFKTVNDKINKMVLMDVWNKLPDTQMPKEVIIKDGKPFIEIIDLVEDIKKQVAESKTVWEESLK